MAEKIFNVPGIGDVSFFKRRGTRNIRLKIDVHGNVVVTLPYLVPYSAAVKFAAKHADWATHEKQKHVVVLPDGMQVGRAHRLYFEHDFSAVKPRARVDAQDIIVKYSTTTDATDVQAAARRAIIRALKKEAEQFLPKRLRDIASAEGYTYSGSSVKQLKGRWGSCDQNKHIILNIYLMQLPVELIDYVIYHELAHTRALNHGEDFWREFEAHLPEAKLLRRQMKLYQPSIPAKRSV